VAPDDPRRPRPGTLWPGELPEAQLWLVGHRAHRQIPRIAAVWDWLVEMFDMEG